MRFTRRAFTYLELLAIVAILGVLAAIVVPRLPFVQEAAVQSTVRTNLHRVRTQLEIYFNRYHHYPPSITALTEAGYLESEPSHPGTGTFEYNPETGAFWSTMNTAW